ncbi:hypothetical protein N7451_004870 [Penicillium sp. IBT 35674x]|nr:hypothetical protein N7451_004870 [Penicillium sp. IBT 35674x]
MPAMFRRTSDLFKHFNQRHDSVHSEKPVLESHNSSVRSSHADLAVDTAPHAIMKETHPKKQRVWSFGSQDEDEREKRRLMREERERADFAATRRYSSARRRSNGAGIGFEGGWQG